MQTLSKEIAKALAKKNKLAENRLSNAKNRMDALLKYVDLKYKVWGFEHNSNQHNARYIVLINAQEREIKVVTFAHDNSFFIEDEERCKFKDFREQEQYKKRANTVRAAIAVITKLVVPEN